MPSISTNILNRIFIIFFTWIFTIPLFAQESQISFGKNRVQYKDFDWQFYETDNFRVYFYQGGQDMGKYAILSSEKCFAEISKLLNYKLSDKLELIVYNDISDMHQTNIGIKQNTESISGTINLQNNILFVYFNGKHSDLDKQIKEGLTRLYLDDIVKGSGFQEVVQNSFMLNLPSWFTEGLVKYTGTPWSTELENQLREGILSGRFSNLTKLTAEEMELVGHSIWNFIEEKHGKDGVGNLLYLTRVNRSVEDGILFVTGRRMEDFLYAWYKQNYDKFEKEYQIFEKIKEQDLLALKKQKLFEKYQVHLSPDGKFLAYSSNHIGRWKVHVYDIATGETKTLLKGGFKTTSLETDLSNPMLAWEPKSKKLSVVFEKKDVFFLSHYLVEEDFKRELKPDALSKFQKVYDFSYAEDSRNLLFSAMQKSQIDIFKLYTPTQKTTQITNDFYDDLQPSFIKIAGRSGVIFSSNRPDDVLRTGGLDTILPNGQFDVFFYDFNNPVQKLSQISFTPLADETYPQAFSDTSYTFLSNVSGIQAQYVGNLEYVKVGEKYQYVYSINEELGFIDSIVLDKDIKLDSALAEGQTLNEIISQHTVDVYKLQGVYSLYKKYFENISALSVAPSINKQVESVRYNLENQFVLSNLDYLYTKSNDTSAYMKKKLLALEELLALEALQDSTRNLIASSTSNSEIENKEIIYQSKFDGWDTLSVAHREAYANENENANEEVSTAYKFSRTRQYFLKFSTENLSGSLDNSLLFTNYQPFNDGVFRQPFVNPMFKFGITDLFEDHKLFGGIRLPLFSNLNPKQNGQVALPFKIGFLENFEIFVSYENFKKRIDKSLTFYHKNFNEITGIIYPTINISTIGILNTKTNLVESKFTYPFNQLNSLRLKVGFRNDRFIIKSTDIFNLSAANSSQNWVYNRLEFVHDHTLPVSKNIKNGFRANVYFEFQKEFPTKEDTVLKQNVQLPIFNNAYLMLWGFDARHYQKVYKTIIWANRVAYSTSVGTKKMVYYLGGTEGLINPGFNNTTIVSQDNNYAFQSLAVNMHGFQQNIRNGNSFAVWNSELRIPIFSAFSRGEIKSGLLENFQLIGFFDVGTAWEGFSPFGKGNIAQEIRQNATENPTAIARVDVYKEPIVMGFGSGIRTELMGYFVRLDLGWGYDTGNINKPRFQFALGYDF